jgi:hypothetical protein
MRLLFSALALCAAILGQAADKDYPLADAQEVRARGGLPNFFRKAQTIGAELKIGYLGGSITAQNGWRVQTLAHFKKANPHAAFTEINAAIGGTGSDLGVFRVQQDVLSKGPDLLFVEFAVNDWSATDTTSSQSWRLEQYSLLSSSSQFFIKSPITSKPCCFKSQAVTDESTPPDIPTTTLEG